MTFERGNRRNRNWLRSVPLANGVVSRFDPRWIPEGAAVELLNVDLTDPTRPRKRQGYTGIEAASTGLLGGRRVSGFGYLDAGAGSKLLVASQSGTTGQVSWVRSPDVLQGWTAASTFNVNTDDCKMFQGNFLLWLVTGSGANIGAVAHDGTFIDCGDENGSPPRGAVDGVSLFQRVIFFDDDGMYWSKIFPTRVDLEDRTAFDRTNASGLSTISGFAELSPPFGGRVIAAAVWNQQTIVVFYDTATLEVVFNGSDPLLSTVNVLEPRFGCSARGSVSAIGREIYFQDQYGDLRSMAQTITGAQQGMVPDPVSEPIDPYLPGKITSGYLHKTRSLIYSDYLYVWVAGNPSKEANTLWTFDLSTRMWYGPSVMANGFGQIISSDIDGKTQRIFASDGSTNPAFYEVFDGSYSDNGVAIKYRESSRMFHGDVPEKNKQPRFVEAWAKGLPDSNVKVRLRTGEDQSWTRVLAFDLEDNGSIFPIKEAGHEGSIFPIREAGEAGSPFPIAEAFPLLTRGWENLEVPIAGEFDIPNSRFPIPTQDFPLLDVGGGVVSGRFVQWQIEEESIGPFERQAIHVATDVQETVRDDED